MSKLIYIAAPYRDPRGSYFVQENINRAREAAAAVWKAGGYALCPHLNTAHFDGLVSDEQFLAAGLKMVSRCDATVMLNGWDMSAGCLKEHNESVAYDKWMFFEYLPGDYRTADGSLTLEEFINGA